MIMISSDFNYEFVSSYHNTIGDLDKFAIMGKLNSTKERFLYPYLIMHDLS